MCTAPSRKRSRSSSTQAVKSVAAIGQVARSEAAKPPLHCLARSFTMCTTRRSPNRAERQHRRRDRRAASANTRLARQDVANRQLVVAGDPGRAGCQRHRFEVRYCSLATALHQRVRCNRSRCIRRRPSRPKRRRRNGRVPAPWAHRVVDAITTSTTAGLRPRRGEDGHGSVVEVGRPQQDRFGRDVETAPQAEQISQFERLASQLTKASQRYYEFCRGEVAQDLKLPVVAGGPVRFFPVASKFTVIGEQQMRDLRASENRRRPGGRFGLYSICTPVLPTGTRRASNTSSRGTTGTCRRSARTMGS